MRPIKPLIAAVVIAPLLMSCSGEHQHVDHETTASPTPPETFAANDVCLVLSADEVGRAVGATGLPATPTDRRPGSESCSWGGDSVGYISVSWWSDPPPQTRSTDQRSIELSQRVGLPSTLSGWDGRSCRVSATVGGDRSIGIHIIPADTMLNERPPVGIDDVCGRNLDLIANTFPELAAISELHR
ncbi:hypothetical protein [Nocardia thailandica]|uniref:DUF3558 domain-containing protein n=1 Tax=Nocardia thailandica TaxID=257275 RepID=A0ABW6PHU2_9NOCA